MDWVQVVIGILEIVAIIILGLFLKNYFPSYMDEKGKFNINDTGLVMYSHGEYFELGKKLGKFGYSVAKKPAVKAETVKKPARPSGAGKKPAAGNGRKSVPKTGSPEKRKRRRK